MQFQGKKVLNNLLIALFILAALICAVYFSYVHITDLRIRGEREIERDVFLEQIESGDLVSSTEIWPSVYTYSKDNGQFLIKFSQTLNAAYYNFYKERYINESPAEDLYEISRIYYDFISEDDFESVIDRIFNDYYNERIGYVQYASAAHDFYAISRRTSTYLAELIYKASDLHDSRNTYSQALAAADIGDYNAAISLMRMVIPEDMIYYPLALEKIDEYILKLRDLVKDGS